MSLGELSISEISVLELTICLAELHDPTPFKQTALHFLRQREALLNPGGLPVAGLTMLFVNLYYEL